MDVSKADSLHPEQLGNDQDLGVRPNFEVQTGTLIRQSDSEWKLDMESVW